MSLKNKTAKIIVGILGIVVIVGAVALMIYGIVNYFMTLAQTDSGDGVSTQKLMIPIYISAPLLFLGVFLFILGFGKKKEV